MIKSIETVKVKDRRVILRAGFDIPLKQGNGWEVADNARIKDVLPTLNYLISQKAKIIIMAHLGRPEGWDKDKSQWPVAQKLSELLNYKVEQVTDRLPDYSVPHLYFLPSDITKHDYSGLTQSMRGGDILFLENLRFYPGEKKSTKEFVTILAKYGDVYVQEAFSNAHRADASMHDLAKQMPRYAGISFLNEIKSLRKITQRPQQPLIVIMGGAKIDDKVATLNNLAENASQVVLGGAIANTFLKALGYDLGKSKISDVTIAKQILRHYKEKIVLPLDVVVATEPEARPRLTKIDKIRPNEAIYDIGPETIRKFTAIVKTGKTLVWNGPFGVFENPRYAFGSKSIAQAFASRARGKAFGVVGGGETVELIDQTKLGQFVDHLSTGGGAMLEFLAGKELPAVKVLENQD